MYAIFMYCLDYNRCRIRVFIFNCIHLCIHNSKYISKICKNMLLYQYFFFYIKINTYLQKKINKIIINNTIKIINNKHNLFLTLVLC
jgi:hypothetical protein